jgi:hypothetical protein
VLEVHLQDAGGVDHVLIDKEPVLLAEGVELGELPSPITLGCAVDKVDGAEVTVTIAHHVTDRAGQSTFVVAREAVVSD